MRNAVRQAFPQAAGFTMVEILVVIMIVGILAAIAAPSWQGLAASRRASMAQNEILQTLRQAQADALRTRQPKRVTFDTEATPPTIRVNNSDPIRLGEESTQSRLPSTILGLEVSSSSTTDDNVVEFDARGMVSEGAGMIITATSPANRGNRRCVIVETLLGTLRTDQNDGCNPPS